VRLGALFAAACLASGAAWAQVPPPAATNPNAITSLTHDATTGDLMATTAAGAVIDAGIANQRGNNTFQTFSTTADQPLVVNCGTNKVFITGSASVASMILQLPPCPRGNDSVLVSSNVAIGQLYFIDYLGNALTNFPMLTPYQSASMFYGSAWSIFTMPPLPYTLTAAGIAAALGYTPLQTAPVSSVAGRTGVVTLSVGDVAGLGTAASQAAGAFLTPAQAAAAYYPLTTNTANYLTNTPAATLTTIGGLKTNVTYFNKATYSATFTTLALLGIGLIATPVAISVPAASLGDNCAANWPGAAPAAGLFINACQVLATGTVTLYLAATGALSLSGGVQSVNISVWH
jgi:hypothetical protein